MCCEEGGVSGQWCCDDQWLSGVWRDCHETASHVMNQVTTPAGGIFSPCASGLCCHLSLPFEKFVGLRRAERRSAEQIWCRHHPLCAVNVKSLRDERKMSVMMIKYLHLWGTEARSPVENKGRDVNVWNLQLALSIPMASGDNQASLTTRRAETRDNLPDNVPYQIRPGVLSCQPHLSSHSISWFPSLLSVSFFHFSQDPVLCFLPGSLYVIETVQSSAH